MSHVAQKLNSCHKVAIAGIGDIRREEAVGLAAVTVMLFTIEVEDGQLLQDASGAVGNPISLKTGLPRDLAAENLAGFFKSIDRPGTVAVIADVWGAWLADIQRAAVDVAAVFGTPGSVLIFLSH